jgi:hypothetical protein
VAELPSQTVSWHSIPLLRGEQILPSPFSSGMGSLDSLRDLLTSLIRDVPSGLSKRQRLVWMGKQVDTFLGEELGEPSVVAPRLHFGEEVVSSTVTPQGVVLVLRDCDDTDIHIRFFTESEDGLDWKIHYSMRGVVRGTWLITQLDEATLEALEGQLATVGTEWALPLTRLREERWNLCEERKVALLESLNRPGT